MLLALVLLVQSVEEEEEVHDALAGEDHQDYGSLEERVRTLAVEGEDVH